MWSKQYTSDRTWRKGTLPQRLDHMDIDIEVVDDNRGAARSVAELLGAPDHRR